MEINKTKEQIIKEMDDAATVAENELAELSDEEITPVAKWFHKHYMKAGHKRLGRLLVQATKELRQ